MKSEPYDIIIAGAGIIGLSTAMQISQLYPRYKIAILEKESQLAFHQTGNNSGVMHSGIYYNPGSLKARNCVTGVEALKNFCDLYEINYDLCGKVIVATTNDEIPALNELHRRGIENGVPGLEMIDRERLIELEPHASGVKAIWSPNTGIIDYKEVATAYSSQFLSQGGEIFTDVEILGSSETASSIRLETTQGEYTTRWFINCTGLQADLLAQMMGVRLTTRNISFRGEYYTLNASANYLVRGLIYPVPNPQFPFLGAHFTKTLYKGIEAGPNAVLAFAREGYRMRDINLNDCWNLLRYKGFWAMSGKYWKTGISEFYRSFSKTAFTKALQKLVPEVTENDLTAGGAGVRAQAISPDGKLVDDFLIHETARAIHVLNAPSPGATASLAIGSDIAEKARARFELSA